MGKLYRFVWVVTALLISSVSYAEKIEVSGAWTRATAPGQEAAGVDLSITSQRAASLVGVSSPASATAELHGMSSENGMMKMREVKVIELPAGKLVNLRESGYHLMLNGLKAPLKEGDSIPLSLSIKMANKRLVKVETKAEVKSLTATGAVETGSEHHHNH